LVEGELAGKVEITTNNGSFQVRIMLDK